MKKSSTGWQAEQGLEKLFGADGCISSCAGNRGQPEIITAWAGRQKAALQELVTTAQQKLTQDAANRSLEEHIQEAEELLGKDEAASAEIGSLIAELTQLTSDGEEKGGSGEKKAH